MRPAVLTIERAAIRANIAAVREWAHGARLYAVAKANAYGHGLEVVGPWLLEDGADRLAVVFLDEALAVGAVLPDGCARVLVLGAMLPEDADEAVASGAELSVHSHETARAVSDAAVKERRLVSVHLKVDTGMSRLGVEPGSVAEMARLLEALPGVRLTGAFTHLATADERDDSRARAQLARWDEACAALPSGVVRHVCASAAVVRFRQHYQDAVRPGLLVYGIDPMAGAGAGPPLRPALRLTARIVQTREIGPGDAVSYGATFVADKPTRVGVIPVGYADGWPRSLSRRGHVLIGGRRAPILGRVCMDHFMVDLSDTAGADVGDVAVLIGEGLEVGEVADLAGTIHHEIVSRLGARLRREYVPPAGAGLAPPSGLE